MLLNFINLGGLQLSRVEISWVGIFLDINFLGGICPGWGFSRWALSWVGIFQVEVVRVGVILGGNCPGGSYPGWGFSLMGVFRVGNCPVGIIRVAIFRVGVFMLPLLAPVSKYWGKL